MKCALIFPGQGSQTSMMGKDLYQSNEIYKAVFDQAIAIEPELESVVFSENDERINDTYFAQLAIVANQYGLLSMAKGQFELSDYATAGFSLGEFSALLAAGTYDYDTALEIIQARSKAMAKLNGIGTMQAAIGLTKEELGPLLNKLNHDLGTNIHIANHNGEKQIVLAGLSEDFTIISDELLANGLRKLVPLSVSGAFHTDIYTSAADEFISTIDSSQFNDFNCPVYSNVTGERFINKPDEDYFKAHMISGVNWFDEVKTMMNDGIDTFIEFGEVSVLNPMIKRINRKTNLIHIKNEDDLSKLEDIWTRK